MEGGWELHINYPIIPMLNEPPHRAWDYVELFRACVDHKVLFVRGSLGCFDRAKL